MPRTVKASIIARSIVISDAPGEGWHVSVTPSDRPLVQDLWFARRDCARAFARGLSAAVAAWSVTDASTSRSKEVERAKADALAQLDLFMTDHGRSP